MNRLVPIWRSQGYFLSCNSTITAITTNHHRKIAYRTARSRSLFVFRCSLSKYNKILRFSQPNFYVNATSILQWTTDNDYDFYTGSQTDALELVTIQQHFSAPLTNHNDNPSGPVGAELLSFVYNNCNRAAPVSMSSSLSASITLPTPVCCFTSKYFAGHAWRPFGGNDSSVMLKSIVKSFKILVGQSFMRIIGLVVKYYAEF